MLALVARGGSFAVGRFGYSTTPRPGAVVPELLLW
jgi:hypothetical protein